MKLTLKERDENHGQEDRTIFREARSAFMASKRVSAKFYRSERGAEPVREWLMDLSKEDRKRIGTDIKSVEFAWPIGMPTVKALKKKLWEIRTDLDSGRISRVFFTIRGSDLILLHGIIKKSQKTPKNDLDLARKRAGK